MTPEVNFDLYTYVRIYAHEPAHLQTSTHKQYMHN